MRDQHNGSRLVDVEYYAHVGVIEAFCQRCCRNYARLAIRSGLPLECLSAMCTAHPVRPVGGKDDLVSITDHYFAGHCLLVLRQGGGEVYDLVGQAMLLRDYRPCGAPYNTLHQRMCDCAGSPRHDLLSAEVESQITAEDALVLGAQMAVESAPSELSIRSKRFNTSVTADPKGAARVRLSTEPECSNRDRRRLSQPDRRTIRSFSLTDSLDMCCHPYDTCWTRSVPAVHWKYNDLSPVRQQSKVLCKPSQEQTDESG